VMGMSCMTVYASQLLLGQSGIIKTMTSSISHRIMD